MYETTGEVLKTRKKKNEGEIGVRMSQWWD